MTGVFEDVLAEVKNVYGPAELAAAAYRTETRFRRDLHKTDLEATEGILKFQLRLNGMWSQGITADYGAFPNAKDPNNQVGQLTGELFTSAIGIGMKARMQVKSGKSSFNGAGLTGDRIKQNAEETGAFINRVYLSTNRGRLAKVLSDGSSTFVCDKPAGARLIEEGMDLEAYDAFSGGSVRDSFSGHRVTVKNPETDTITYINATTLATDDRTLVAGDHIFIKGSYARTPVTLPDIVDDGTNCPVLFGLTRSAQPKMNAYVKGANGVPEAITETIVLDMIATVEDRTNKRITKLISNSGLTRRYLQHMAAERRQAGVDFSSGYREGSFPITTPSGTVEWEIHLDALPRTLFGLAWDQFFLYEALPLDWVTGDTVERALRLAPTSGGFLAGYVGYMASIENMGNHCPRANFRRDDLADPLAGD